MTMAEPSSSSDQGSPFWRFSLQLYRLPGVAEACIELQEKCGADVNLLLFLLWTLLASMHLLRRTWRKPVPVAHAQATAHA